MGRKQNDVFVLGDESLIAEPIGGRDLGGEGVEETEDLSGEPSPSGHPAGGVPSSVAPSIIRRLAVLGLAAGTAAVAGGLALFNAAAGHKAPAEATTSPARPLVSGPALRRAAPLAPAAPRRSLVSKPKSRKGGDEHRSRSRGEPERETTSIQAPESSPVSVPVLVPTPASAPATASLPPSASPPFQRGASGGGEEFGFER